MRRYRLALGSATCLLLLGQAPVSATDVCSVQNSADGFIALRAKPAADSHLLARAKAGHAVVIQKTSGGDQIVSGRWLRVLYFASATAPRTSDPDYAKGQLAWMHARFVNDCG